MKFEECCIFKNLMLLTASISIGACSLTNIYDLGQADIKQDWQNIPLPEVVSNRGEWRLKSENSDSFNYQGKTSEFNNKWHDNHIRDWKGPGATHFSAQHSDVEEGKLVLSASPVPEGKQGSIVNYGKFESKKTIYTGFVTAKVLINYPVFVEASLKISKLALANNFWMLSDDDRNEIDVTETYGDTPKTANHMSSNYHIFKRDPDTNDMLGDYGHKQAFHKPKDKSLMYDKYHRFGFYWHSPTQMEFYLNGELVRTLNTENDLNDPENKFMDRAMRLIFDMEDHVWRARKGISPTTEQLTDQNLNKMYVDWIRTYKPKL